MLKCEWGLSVSLSHINSKGRSVCSVSILLWPVTSYCSIDNNEPAHAMAVYTGYQVESLQELSNCDYPPVLLHFSFTASTHLPDVV